MESFLIRWGYAAVFLFGFLEACCIPIPSGITFGFAGVLAGEGHLSIVGIIVVGTIAELIGSFVAYAVGRPGGRPLVHRFGRYLLITRADIDRAERFVAGRGVWSIPLGRALPVIRRFVSIVAGIIEMPPLLFGVLNLIGTAVWVTVSSSSACCSPPTRSTSSGSSLPRPMKHRPPSAPATRSASRLAPAEPRHKSSNSPAS